MCSAVSSAVILTANLLQQEDTDLLAMIDDGVFALYSEHNAAAFLLNGLRDHLQSLQKQYPQYIRVYNLILNGGNTNV